MLLRIGVSSSTITGAYACLEIILCFLLVRCLNITLGCWNVKRIYDDKATLNLSSSRFEALSGGGHSSKKVSIMTMVAHVTVAVLAAIGGFAFVGVTEPEYELVTVKNLVRRSAAGHALDLRKHILYREELMSGTAFLLLQSFGCNRASHLVTEVLEYWNTLDDLTTPLFEADLPITNQTCLSERAGYREKIYFIRNSSHFSDHFARNSQRCKVNYPWQELQWGNLTEDEVEQDRHCAYSTTERWCIRTSYYHSFCMASLRKGDAFGFEMAAYEHQIDGEYVYLYPVEEEVSAATLMAMTMLMEFSWPGSALEAYWTALLTVEKNASVEKFVGPRSITEVNVALLAATLGPAVIILIIVGVLSAVAWVKVLVVPGRLSYNRFCSPLELLSLAASIAFEDGRSHLQQHEGILIGISSKEPHVGPLLKTEARGKSLFLEEELVGRSMKHGSGTRARHSMTC